MARKPRNPAFLILAITGADGIRVERKATPERRWLYDLWLAERLADSL